MWNEIEKAIDAGGEVKLFINSSGNICLDNGSNGPVLPKKLIAKLSPELKTKAAAVSAEKQAASDARLNVARAEQKARDDSRELIINKWRERKVWGLTGFYVEEMTGPRYTFDEIEAWHQWAGISQFKNNDLNAVCYGDEEKVGEPIVAVNLYRFYDMAGTQNKHRKFSFNLLVKDLESHVAERRERKARSN